MGTVGGAQIDGITYFKKSLTNTGQVWSGAKEKIVVDLTSPCRHQKNSPGKGRLLSRDIPMVERDKGIGRSPICSLVDLFYRNPIEECPRGADTAYIVGARNVAGSESLRPRCLNSGNDPFSEVP